MIGGLSQSPLVSFESTCERMMIPTLAKTDLEGAGFTLGFGLLTFWEAAKQSLRTRHPARSIYVYMVWAEFTANAVMAIISYLLFTHHLKISLGVLIVQLCMWSLQIQLLPQIIINRISVILGDRRQSTTLKWSVAGVILAINISVFCICSYSDSV